MVKLFITGATGYIGGDALHAIVEAHPEYEITTLVRNSDKGALVAQQYGNIKMAYGDLNSEQLLIEQASQADIICHFANADHEQSVRSLIKGLVLRTAETPGFLIHTSGSGILMFDDLNSKTYGEPSETIYDDLEGIGTITSLPDSAPHRNIDKIVLAAGAVEPDRIKTAIVCPPCIYGRGRGPGNRRSVQLPDLCRATIKAKTGLQVGAGKARWSTVHVHDLSTLFLRLVEEAAAGGTASDWNGKPDVWGVRGYYFAENGEEEWGMIGSWVAEEAKKRGFIPTGEVQTIASEEANQLGQAGGALWGANSRSRAKRARKVLKWNPTGMSLKDEVASAVEFEARDLGLIKGHAERIAVS